MKEAPSPAFVPLAIPRNILNEMAAWAQREYPYEGCGILIGTGRTAKRFKILVNLAKAGSVMDPRLSTLPFGRRENGGKTEFAMDPAEFQRESLEAWKEGFDVIGIVHTHPDHAAIPSEIDSAQPFLSQWSNIIISVEDGVYKGLRAWFRENEREPFIEEYLSFGGHV